jgi:hypothetical protein
MLLIIIIIILLRSFQTTKDERKKEKKKCFVFWDFVGFFQTTQNKRETNERNPIPIFCYFYLFFFFEVTGRGVVAVS